MIKIAQTVGCGVSTVERVLSADGIQDLTPMRGIETAANVFSEAMMRGAEECAGPRSPRRTDPSSVQPFRLFLAF
jgi:hypothetical protein